MTVYAPASTLYSQKMISLRSRLIACCKLAPTLARQMWRHNYIIDRNECLIFALLESTNPWVYLLQFLFKSTNNSWIYERKCEWVFFFWTQCIWPQSEQTVTQLRKLSRFIHRDLYWSSLQLWYAFHWCMPLKILRTFHPKTTARTRC